MVKNITIAVLVLVIAGLLGYIIIKNVPNNKDQKLTASQEEEKQNTETEKQANFVYSKGSYVKKDFQLVVSDLKGLKKSVVASGGIYQYMSSQKGTSLYLSKVGALGGYDIDFVTVDSNGKIKTITPFSGSFSENVQSAYYSVDGSKIYFNTLDSSNYINTPSKSGYQYTEEVYSVNSDGTNLQKLTSNLAKDLKINDLYTFVGVSKENNLFFTLGDQVQAGNQAPGLWVFDVNKKTLSKLDDGATVIFGGAKISPDGTKLAYISYTETSGVGSWTAAKPYSVKVMDLVTENKEDLVTDLNNTFGNYFVWSPDSKQLVAMKGSKYIIIDIAQKYTREFGFEGQIIGWASDTNVVFVRKIENSATTSADNVYELRVTGFDNQSDSTLIDTSTGSGYSYFGVL